MKNYIKYNSFKFGLNRLVFFAGSPETTEAHTSKTEEATENKVRPIFDNKENFIANASIESQLLMMHVVSDLISAQTDNDKQRDAVEELHRITNNEKEFDKAVIIAKAIMNSPEIKTMQDNPVLAQANEAGREIRQSPNIKRLEKSLTSHKNIRLEDFQYLVQQCDFASGIGADKTYKHELYRSILNQMFNDMRFKRNDDAMEGSGMAYISKYIKDGMSDEKRESFLAYTEAYAIFSNQEIGQIAHLIWPGPNEATAKIISINSKYQSLFETIIKDAKYSSIVDKIIKYTDKHGVIDATTDDGKKLMKEMNDMHEAGYSIELINTAVAMHSKVKFDEKIQEEKNWRLEFNQTLVELKKSISNYNPNSKTSTNKFENLIKSASEFASHLHDQNAETLLKYINTNPSTATIPIIDAYINCPKDLENFEKRFSNLKNLVNPLDDESLKQYLDAFIFNYEKLIVVGIGDQQSIEIYKHIKSFSTERQAILNTLDRKINTNDALTELNHSKYGKEVLTSLQKKGFDDAYLKKQSYEDFKKIIQSVSVHDIMTDILTARSDTQVEMFRSIQSVENELNRVTNIHKFTETYNELRKYLEGTNVDSSPAYQAHLGSSLQKLKVIANDLKLFDLKNQLGMLSTDKSSVILLPKLTDLYETYIKPVENNKSPVLKDVQEKFSRLAITETSQAFVDLNKKITEIFENKKLTEIEKLKKIDELGKAFEAQYGVAYTREIVFAKAENPLDKCRNQYMAKCTLSGVATMGGMLWGATTFALNMAGAIGSLASNGVLAGNWQQAMTGALKNGPYASLGALAMIGGYESLQRQRTEPLIDYSREADDIAQWLSIDDYGELKNKDGETKLKLKNNDKSYEASLRIMGADNDSSREICARILENAKNREVQPKTFTEIGLADQAHLTMMRSLLHTYDQSQDPKTNLESALVPKKTDGTYDTNDGAEKEAKIVSIMAMLSESAVHPNGWRAHYFSKSVSSFLANNLSTEK